MSDENLLAGSNQPDTSNPDQAAEVSTPVEAEAKVEENQSEATETQQARTNEGSEATEDSSDDGDKKARKSEMPEWVKDLRRDNRNLKRRLTKAYKENERLKSEKPISQEDFDDPADYTAAKLTRASDQRAASRQLQEIHEEAAESRQQAWEKISAEMRGEIPNFNEVVFSDKAPFTEAMSEVLLETNDPGRTAFYLASNLSELNRIARMSPVEAALEIGRIEARLTPPKPKTVSSAPKPVSTVTGKASAPQPKDLNTLAASKDEDATAVIEEMRRRAAGR